MTTSIATVRARESLKPRHAPYWQQIRRGAFVGFRKLSASSPGAWVARFRDDEGTRHFHTLGAFEDYPPSERFDRAKDAADEWFKHMGRGGRDEGATVEDACRAYLETLSDSSRKDAEGRFKRWIFSDGKFAGTELVKLKRSQVRAWRTKLEKTPAIPQDKTSTADQRERSAASVNRDITPLRAALYLALENGHLTTDEPWKTALKPVEGAGRRRNVYLDAQQRRMLVEAAQADLQPFLRALCMLPLRPGAVAELTVRDLEARTSELTIGRDKTGEARRITLPPVTCKLFVEAAKGKLPAAPLFARADGKAWNKDSWKSPLKDAVETANLRSDATAYALRHSTITDLLALHRLDTLTVAMLSGTSLAMIEKHYGHLVRQHAMDALAKLNV